MKVIIALGENARYGSGKKEISKDHHHLSVHGKIVAKALLFLLKNGYDKAIISGGFTTGKQNPTEASAMKKYILFLDPNFNQTKLILEEKSITTQTNAIEVKKLISNKKDELFLLAPGFHIPRGIKVFGTNGLKVKPLVAEEVIKNRSYRKSKLYKIEKIKEAFFNLVLILDPHERIQQKLAEATRK